MFCLNLIVFVVLLHRNVLAIRNGDGAVKIESRQSQSFFPREDSTNPNFSPSASDVHFTDTNAIQEHQQQNLQFSNNLREDLYQQYSPYQQQQQQPQLQQHQPQQQQFQTGEYNPLIQQQYNPTSNIQPQYSPQSQNYLNHPPGFGPIFSPAVTGNYPFAGPSHAARPPHPPSPPFQKRRPTYSLYPPNHRIPYAGGAQPIYQSQQNYPVGPNGYESDNGNGGIMESISNFFSNIGQGAADLLNPNPNPIPGNYRPPINGYRPPDSIPQQQVVPGQSIYGRPNAGNPNPVNQFSKAIEEITRNDDFQCIPKVICEMVGSQRRQPGILGSPIFSSIISAVPSTSAGLVYGRAALLGLTSGEPSCTTAYPKCPRGEDDLLYYLNNHRGGFFRFFNGGAAFGDDTNYQFKPNPYTYNQQQQNQPQYHYQQAQQMIQQQQYQQQQQTSLGSNLAALQSFADNINSGNGINLSNLGANSDLFSGLANLVGSGGGGGSNAAPALDLSSLASNAGLLGNLAGLLGGGGGNTAAAASPSAGQGQGITDLVGNLLTGFVGNRFSGRRISKRSIESFPSADETNVTVNSDVEEVEKKLSASKRKLAATTKKEKRREIVYDDEVEGRIINSKPKIYANDNSNGNEDDGPLRFTFYSHRDSKKVSFNGPNDVPATSNGNPYVSFYGSHENENDANAFRLPTATQSSQNIHFQNFGSENGQNFNRRPNQFFPLHNDVERDPHEDRGHSTKMIFPDRTGTGNLKFDNEAFSSTGHRFGRILNGGTRYPQTSYFAGNQPNDNRIAFNDAATNTNQRYESNRRPQQYYQQSSSSSNYQPNRFVNQNQYDGNQFNSHSNRQPTASHTNNYSNNFNRYGNQNSNQSNGNDNSSQNIYVTNSKGIIEYYIDPTGQKHYV